MNDKRYPLEGYRVVDLTQVWAGPQLAQCLGDMGAEVIRVESRLGTDFGRMSKVPYSQFRTLLTYARHARSRAHYITINLLEKCGRGFFRDLIRMSDIFVCNLSPRVMRTFGLDYERLRQDRPDLVMASISAAGQEGSWSDLTAYGPSMNAVVGSDSLVGYPDTSDLMSSYWDPDPLMGSAGVFAVLLALYHREASGEGQHIDLTFAELLTSFLGEPLLETQMTDETPLPRGNLHPTHVPHGIYSCKDEDTWLSIDVAKEEEWLSLCRAIGNPKLAQDERFVTSSRRREHSKELDEIITNWSRQYTNYQAMELLQNAGVAGVPAMTIGEIFHDVHDTHRRTSIAINDSDFDKELATYGIPWRLSKTPGAFQRLGQRMGADNLMFFGAHFGLSQSAVEALEKGRILH